MPYEQRLKALGLPVLITTKKTKRGSYWNI